MTLVVVSLSLFVQTQLRVASDVQGDVCPGRASETAMSDTNVSRVSDSVQQCPILQHANVLIFHMSANLSRKLRDSWSYDMKQTQSLCFSGFLFAKSPSGAHTKSLAQGCHSPFRVLATQRPVAPVAPFRRCHHHGDSMACWFTNWTKATSVSGSPQDIPKWKHLDGNKENYVKLQYITSLIFNSAVNDTKLQITNDIWYIKAIEWRRFLKTEPCTCGGWLLAVGNLAELLFHGLPQHTEVDSQSPTQAPSWVCLKKCLNMMGENSENRKFPLIIKISSKYHQSSCFYSTVNWRWTPHVWINPSHLCKILMAELHQVYSGHKCQTLRVVTLHLNSTRHIAPQHMSFIAFSVCFRKSSSPS